MTSFCVDSTIAEATATAPLTFSMIVSLTIGKKKNFEFIKPRDIIYFTCSND